MVVACCAFRCINRHGKPGTKLYRFPTDPDLKAKWLAAIKREKWEPTEYSRTGPAPPVRFGPYHFSRKNLKWACTLLNLLKLVNRIV